MKPLILFGLLVLSVSASHAAQSDMKLQIQKSAAQPAHLTTRIQWINFPQIHYQNSDLEQQNRAAIIRVYADEAGEIKQATIQESTGLKALDQKLMNAVRQAKVKPYTKDDTTLASIGYQVFHLNLTEEDRDTCHYYFDSKNWLAQHHKQNVPFYYQAQPILNLDSIQLNGQNRHVKFSFKADPKGQIKNLKIIQSSGLPALDQQVLHAVANSKVTVKRTASTLWLYKKSKFTDTIVFDSENCR